MVTFFLHFRFVSSGKISDNLLNERFHVFAFCFEVGFEVGGRFGLQRFFAQQHTQKIAHHNTQAHKHILKAQSNEYTQ